jgi:hypothetical protein
MILIDSNLISATIFLNKLFMSILKEIYKQIIEKYNLDSYNGY